MPANESRFSQGWEAGKRGEPLESNPEQHGTWKYWSWSEGWLKFRDMLITKEAAREAKRAKDQQKKGRT